MAERPRSRRRRRRVVLFEREGASMVSSWTDIIELTRHRGGWFTLRITGVPFCREDGPPWIAFESTPFRTADAFLEALDAAAKSRGLDLLAHDTQQIADGIAAFDGALHREVTEALTPKPAPEDPRCGDCAPGTECKSRTTGRPRRGASSSPSRCFERRSSTRRSGRPLDGSVTERILAGHAQRRRGLALGQPTTGLGPRRLTLPVGWPATQTTTGPTASRTV